MFLSSAVTMTSILEDVGTLVTQVIAWMGNVATAITGNIYLILMCIAVPLVGIGFGALRRLTGRG